MVLEKTLVSRHGDNFSLMKPYILSTFVSKICIYLDLKLLFSTSISQ